MTTTEKDIQGKSKLGYLYSQHYAEVTERFKAGIYTYMKQYKPNRENKQAYIHTNG